jgi:signal transduction histidine kinase/ActR/RegA family two-component response regulator
MSQNPSVLRSGFIGLLAGFATLGMLSVLTFEIDEARRKSEALLQHTLQVESVINRVYGLVEGAESAERGYIITSNPDYLGPYYEAERELGSTLGGLSSLVSDNPSQMARIDRFKPILKDRLEIISRTIKQTMENEVGEATRVIKKGAGKMLMDELRGIIEEMTDEEERLLALRQVDLERETENQTKNIYAASTIMALLAAFALWNGYSQINEIIRARNALEEANEQIIEEARQREILQEQLRQAQKLEALGQLTGGIAHDFNNMLGVIVASLNLLKRKLARGDADYEQFIVSALDGADRAAVLTHRLLAFARRQPLQPRPLNVTQLVEETSHLLRHTLGDTIKIRNFLADDLWAVEADGHELTSVLVNLAVNSRDAMPDGGEFTIETHNLTLATPYIDDNPGLEPGDYVLLVVSDTGAGMTREVLEKVFEPFFTTKPIGKGTGLGLAQVYGFVKQTGGHVEVHSDVGRGTTIKIYLPKYTGDEPTKAVRLGADDSTPRAKPGEVVLVVDEDPRNLALARDLLGEIGYTAIVANGGEAGLAIFAERNDITLLLTDLVMPGIDGVLLAERARALRPDCKILFMTGYAPKSAERNGIVFPGARILAKPFTPEQAARKVREAIDDVD